MPKYNGINHLALVTGDMDATVRYWRDLLGMRLVAGLGREGYRHYFFEISPTDLIAFFQWPNVEKIPEKDHGVPVTGPVAFDHVSIGVADTADLLEIKATLEAADFWVSEIIDHGFIHSIYSFDPNHIPVEFSVGVSQVDIRSKPVMRDRAPSAITQEGPDPQPGKWPAPSPLAVSGDRVVLYPGEGKSFLEESMG